jgi:hypothetical protein
LAKYIWRSEGKWWLPHTIKKLTAPLLKLTAPSAVKVVLRWYVC